MLQFITKVQGKRTIKLYLNPDTKDYMMKCDIRKYIKSLGMSEQEWYDDRFLPKDESGNSIRPVCMKDDCSNECMFLNCVDGYYKCCSVLHGKSFESSLSGFIYKYGEELGKKKFRERSENMSKSGRLEGYIERYGEDEGRRRYEEKVNKCKLSLDNFIKRYGPEDGPIKFKEYRKFRRHRLTKEGYIEKYGLEEGTRRYEVYHENRSKSTSLDTYILKYGLEEGTKRYQNLYDTRSNSHSLENYIKLYGIEKGSEKYNEWINNLSYSKSLEGYIDRYGDDNGVKRWNEDKESRKCNLDGYIRRYGPIEGPKKYEIDNKKSGFSRTLEGYIERYGEEEGTKRYNENIENARYVRSLQGHIDKYGPIEGPKKWESWMSNTGFSRGITGDSSKYSKVSKQLFDEVFSRLYGIVDLSSVKYGFNDEYIVKTGSKNCDVSLVRFLDFSIYQYKIAIEFDGDYWHPDITPDDIIDFSTGVVKNLDIFNQLSREYSLTEILGWKVLHIKECDYYENPGREINKCLNFIKSIVLSK